MTTAEPLVVMAEPADIPEGVPNASLLSVGVTARVEALLEDGEALRNRVGACGGKPAPRDLGQFFSQLHEGALPPVGYVSNTSDEAKERKRFPVHDERTGIEVCEPIDFSTPGEVSCFVYHFTQKSVVDLIYDTATEHKIGDMLLIKIIQPGMLCTAGSGTYNDQPCIYVTPLPPAAFFDKEGIAANNFGTQEHRLAKYGPGGEMATTQGWEWKDTAGNSSPLGHHLVEVCLPLRVNMEALTKAVMTTPEDIKLARKIYMFSPQGVDGRLAAGASPLESFLTALEAGDVAAATKMLCDGDLPVDYTLGEGDVAKNFHGYNLLHAAHLAAPNSVALFKALEACGVPHVTGGNGEGPLEAAHRASPVYRELLNRGPKFWFEGNLARCMVLAALSLNAETLELLLETQDKFSTDPEQVIADISTAREVMLEDQAKFEEMRAAVKEFGGFAVETDDELQAFMKKVCEWGPETEDVRAMLLDTFSQESDNDDRPGPDENFMGRGTPMKEGMLHWAQSNVGECSKALAVLAKHPLHENVLKMEDLKKKCAADGIEALGETVHEMFWPEDDEWTTPSDETTECLVLGRFADGAKLRVLVGEWSDTTVVPASFVPRYEHPEPEGEY